MNHREKCPLCGGPNGCAVELGRDPARCWCMSCKIPKELRKAAEETRLRTGEETGCICRECVERYRRNPDEFKGR